MQTDNTHLIEKPIKYAILAVVVYAISAFLLGYFSQFLALSAFDTGQGSNASWGEIKTIWDFSIERSIRYLIFYFLTFLSLVCFAHSSVRSSPWGLLILLAIIPSAMSFVPFLFSGEFRASSVWALSAMLIALLFLNAKSKNSTKLLRNFIFLLVATYLIPDILSDATQWLSAIHKVALNVYGDRLAESKTWASLLYFAPAALISAGVNFYLIYRLPFNFIRELNDQLEKEDHASNVH